MNHDASHVHPSETVVGYVDPSGRGRGNWSRPLRGRALTVADELGPAPVIEHHAEPETLRSLIANSAVFLVLLVGIAMTLFILGSPR
jgi:hypothetical protein